MKYKLTKKYIENLVVKLFQIQAVTDFGCISKGELGGYIQSEQCLSQSGNAQEDIEVWALEIAAENGEEWRD